MVLTVFSHSINQYRTYSFKRWAGATGDKQLVLLHGFTGSSDNWTHVVPCFRSSNSIIAPDILGHGDSSSPTEASHYSMATIAADIADALTNPVNLVGYSMGGRLALYIAVHYPEKIQTLTLESASPGLQTQTERANRILSDEKLADRIEAEGIESFVDFWKGLPLWTSQATLPEQAKANLRRQRLKNNPTGLANSLRGMGTGQQPSLWDKLPDLRMPVLLITGELDTKFRHIAEQMRQLIPDSTIETITNAGHTTHLEAPDQFCRIVNRFLAPYNKP